MQSPCIALPEFVPGNQTGPGGNGIRQSLCMVEHEWFQSLVGNPASKAATAGNLTRSTLRLLATTSSSYDSSSSPHWPSFIRQPWNISSAASVWSTIQGSLGFPAGAAKLRDIRPVALFCLHCAVVWRSVSTTLDQKGAFPNMKRSDEGSIKVLEPYCVPEGGRSKRRSVVYSSKKPANASS